MARRDISLLGDRAFVLIVLTLLIVGIALFFSAALGLLARDGSSLSRIAMTQIGLGVVPGLIALVALRFVPPKTLLRSALPAYIIAMLLTAAVFVPGVGLEANNATRWINLGPITLQPGEFLKVATIVFFAAYLSQMRTRLKDIRIGLGGFFGVLIGPALILINQPNTSTVIVIGATATVLYFIAGAPLRDFLIIGLVGIALASVLVWQRPYLKDRVMTFLNPAEHGQTTGYQIQQSLIAIGSGGILGRGYGQSVQKFNYLPEPVGDSIFAVTGEELGFLGATILIVLFVAFALRGFTIAATAASSFGSLLAAGLTLLIILAAFLNIGAMLGVAPLTGLPLPFVSHGGTALLTTLAAVGLILNVAAHRKV